MNEAGVKANSHKVHGYEGEACEICGNFTLIRSGTHLKCDTCGANTGDGSPDSTKPTIWPTVRINRTSYLEQVKRDWPDKRKVAHYLADNMDTLSQQCPFMARSTLFRFLAGFGVTIASAKTPEECVDEFLELMKHFACPEPGWEGADLVIEE